jgi:hypothetical protein
MHRIIQYLFPFLVPLSFGGGSGGAIEQPQVDTGASDIRKMQEDALLKEQERQARIKQGMQLIANIFDGNPVSATGQATAGYDPNRPYFYANGQQFQPTMPGEPAELAGLRAKLAKYESGPMITPNAMNQGYINPNIDALKKQIGALEAKHKASLNDGTYAYEEGTRLAREGKLFENQQRSGGFDDTYMQGLRQKYLNYALPQVNQQFNDAKRDSAYALARQGTLNSSIAGDNSSRLAQSKANALTEANVNADATVSDFASKLESQRQALVAQLNSSGDPSQTANLAANAANSLSKQQQFAPVENAFNNATAGFRAYQEASANAPYGAIQGFKSGLQSRGRVVS